MIITKLTSHLQDESPSFTSIYAILVHKNDVSLTLQSLKDDLIPKYLKRVKFLSHDFVCILTNKVHSIFETIKIKIPHKPAYSIFQYEIYKEVWPCIYHHRVDIPIDHSFITKWVHTLENYSKDVSKNIFKDVSNSIVTHSNTLYTNKNTSIPFCSSCLIVDGDVLLSSTFTSPHPLGHAIFQGVDSVSRSRRGYLCTGFDAFITDEPCLSCAMAFVHGRIRRVFCLNKKQEGGVFSKEKFNMNSDLNHRYSVYLISSQNINQ
ncbi:putative inactive tRNA-specific adenosine deaminase-like protein [Vairimorpha necatrix]|uniref:Inactive tRNA-specific adenosine deaminase-like protein n=1 Tax=Vairimorpha necatrix TaxID=6039 RepID=A0AAX4J9M7_9MICR